MSVSKDEKCQVSDITTNGTPCSTTLSSEKQTSTLQLLRSFLSSYVRFTQSPYRQDSILKTIQYSLWLLSKFYRNPKTRNSLTKLQGEISWTRYLLRFFGFPAAIDALDVKSSWASGDTSTKLGRLMSWTMVGYYPLEHLSYLFYKAPGIRWLPVLSPAPAIGATASNSKTTTTTTCPSNSGTYSPAQLASKASAWSCRFWLAWIVLDLVRCTLELKETNEETTKSASAQDATKNESAEKAGCNDDETRADSTTTEGGGTTTFTPKHMRILRDALYVLPALTWSLPKWDTDPLLSGDTVNGLCWLESMLGLYQGVQDFQKN